MSDNTTSASAASAEAKAAIPEKIGHYAFPAHSDDIALDVMKKKPVMIIGHTGTGKTSVIEQLAAHLGQPVVKANMNGQMTISDFVGFYMAQNGEMIWVDGVLPHAMRNGYWLLLDEFDFADAALLSVLHSVTEKNPSLVLKEKGHELVPVHPKFRIFATANAVGAMQGFRHLYQGTRPMNIATLARWQCYIADYLPPAKEAEVLKATVNAELSKMLSPADLAKTSAVLESEDKLMPEEVAIVLVKAAGECRMAFNKEDLQFPFNFRMLADMGERMMEKKQIAKKKGQKLTAEQFIMSAAEIAIFSKITPEDKEVVKGILLRVCLGRTTR